MTHRITRVENDGQEFDRQENDGQRHLNERHEESFMNYLRAKVKEMNNPTAVPLT